MARCDSYGNFGHLPISDFKGEIYGYVSLSVSISKGKFVLGEKVETHVIKVGYI